MMALIDKISLLMDEIETAPEEKAREIAGDLLMYAAQIEDYELALEMEELAYEHLTKW